MRTALKILFVLWILDLALFLGTNVPAEIRMNPRSIKDRVATALDSVIPLALRGGEAWSAAGTLGIPLLMLLVGLSALRNTDTLVAKMNGASGEIAKAHAIVNAVRDACGKLDIALGSGPELDQRLVGLSGDAIHSLDRLAVMEEADPSMLAGISERITNTHALITDAQARVKLLTEKRAATATLYGEVSTLHNALLAQLEGMLKDNELEKRLTDCEKKVGDRRKTIDGLETQPARTAKLREELLALQQRLEPLDGLAMDDDLHLLENLAARIIAGLDALEKAKPNERLSGLATKRDIFERRFVKFVEVLPKIAVADATAESTPAKS